MDLETIPDCSLEEQGVSFKYLAFKLSSRDGEKLLIRGVNFRPYDPEATSRLVRRLRDELAAHGFDESQGDRVEVDGGGTAAVNPYYETVTVFGENPDHGGESDRDAVAEILKRHYAGYEFQSYQPGEEEAPPAKPKKKVAAKPVKKPAAASDADEEEASSDESDEEGEGEG